MITKSAEVSDQEGDLNVNKKRASSEKLVVSKPERRGDPLAVWRNVNGIARPAQHGWSLSAIAREYGLNWRTVKRVVEAGRVRRTYPEHARPTELKASQLEHLARRLVVHPGIRGTVLDREVASDYGYAGSYKLFRTAPARGAAAGTARPGDSIRD